MQRDPSAFEGIGKLIGRYQAGWDAISTDSAELL